MVELTSNTPLKLTTKCLTHSNEFTSICIANKCEYNGPVCYECVFEKHIDHAKQCIPLKYFEIGDIENNKSNQNLMKFKDKLAAFEESMSNFVKELYVDIDNILNDNVDSIEKLSSYRLWKQVKETSGKYIISDELFKKASVNFEYQALNKLKNFFEQEVKNIFGKVAHINDDYKKCLSRGDKITSDWTNSKNTSDYLCFTPLGPNLVCHGMGICEPKNVSTFNSSEIVLCEGTTSKIVASKKIQRGDHTQIKWENHLGQMFFDEPVELKKDTLYVAVERNLEDNGATYYTNGEQKTHDLFKFSQCNYNDCSLGGSNGTAISSGKIPFIIYTDS